MNLVLYEKVNQRNESSKESASEVFPVLYRRRIGRTEHEASHGPRQCRNQIADHEDIMPIMVICACHICPSTTSQRPENPNTEDEGRKTTAGPFRQTVVEEDEGEAWTGGDGDEDLKDGTFGVPVAYRGADRRKPFHGIAVVLVFDNFVVV